MNIGAWLRSLGLGQYEDAFLSNALDAELLPTLTSEDLKEIGVLALGHRKRLIEAIAALQMADDERGYPNWRPETPSAAVSLRPEAERRPITVMFCDLVDSTRLAANLDAEDWRELVGAYLAEASRAVDAFGGHVLKKLGDGLMALFGYPSAHENDAERAARAGLAILSALEGLNARNLARGLPQLAARIGLDSGPVVVEANGEVFGEAPNVAARVQNAAEPGTLLVTSAVQRHIVGLFVAEDRGPHDLKGLADRPTLWRLVRPIGGGRRVSARALTPFIGRQDELGFLARRWGRARASEGQFLQIVGEPGIGKSRLVEQFRGLIADTPHSWIEWGSSQLLQNTPLHPIAEWGRQRFGGPEVGLEKRLADIEAMLVEAHLDPKTKMPFLASVMGGVLPEALQPTLPPEELRRAQLGAVVAWLLASSQRLPLVLAFEDLHWADPTTLDLLTMLADRSAEAPLLVVATTRPEFRAPWPTASHHGVLTLVPLDRAQVRKMVGVIAERHALSTEVVEGVGDRTGGVPLFVEEVTRLMLEGGAQTIPPTLQQSLAARLDRLGAAREVAQIGAVLGREFSHSLLQSVSGLSAAMLDSALEKLAEADLLFVDETAATANYRFKHALIQDAAYESLLKSRRQILHRAAAQSVIAAPDLQPELVAHHFTLGGQAQIAIEWWGKAGDAALRRSAFQEAISHFGKAIEIAEQIDRDGQTPSEAAHAFEADQRNRSIKAKYAQAILITQGHTAEATKAAFGRMNLADSVELEESEQITALYGRWTQVLLSGSLPEALILANAVLAEGQASDRKMLAATAHRWISYTEYYLGSFASSRDHAEQALALFDPRWAQTHGAALGFDFLCGAHLCLALPLALLGEVDVAARHMELAASQAHDSGQPFSIAQRHIRDLQRLWLANRPGDALRIVDALSAIGAAKGVGAWDLHTRLYGSWASGRHADPIGGARAVREAWDRLQQRGERLSDTRALLMLADLAQSAGATDEALDLVAQGLQAVEIQGAAYALAPLHRIRGEALASRDIAQAEEACRSSIRIAREQRARAFELQAAMSLGRLHQSDDRPIANRDVLATALRGFAPTPELPAVAEAQTLLSAPIDSPHRAAVF